MSGAGMYKPAIPFGINSYITIKERKMRPISEAIKRMDLYNMLY